MFEVISLIRSNGYHYSVDFSNIYKFDNQMFRSLLL